MRTSLLLLTLAAAFLGVTVPTPAAAAVVDQSFTYQGQLDDANGPANGLYDFRFRLFTGASGNNPVFSYLTITNVIVTDGRFTTMLNFSNTFSGTAYWLRVDVRTNSPDNSLGFVSLAPRQPLTAVPYASFATNADYAVNAGAAATATTASSAATADIASSVAANAVTAAGISNATITASKLATNIAVWTQTPTDIFYAGVGNVGVGTNAPKEKLHIAGNVRANAFFGEGSALTGLYSLDAADGSPNNVVYVDATGEVGIGTTAPAQKLHVVGNLLATGTITADDRFIADNGTNTAAAFTFSGDGDTGIYHPAANALAVTTAGTERLRVTSVGNIGIGTSTPDANLEIQTTGTNDSALRITSSSALVNNMTPASKLELMDDTNGGWTVEKDIAGNLNIHEGTNAFALHRLSIRKGTGHVGIGDYGDNSQFASRVLSIQGNPSAAQYPGTAAVVLKDGATGGSWSLATYTDGGLHLTKTGGSGFEEVFVPVLTVIGGSDIAEPFNVRSEFELQPGMVVAIDPERTGELRVCTRAYDSTVAGIISGAGGVKTGMTLKQDGTAASGKLPIALTGRVYCYVDADAGGPVVPGDLLTTSDTPGHAMKVTDRMRAGGATLGKAMSSLKDGKGLVLVLVGLQ